MRLTKLWTIPVTALLLTACSTETLTDSTTTPTGDDAVSFARLNVNLPSVPTTRAYTPDYTPDAGTDDEFKVTGKTRIFLFENEKGATAKSEDEYTFLYEAEPTDWISQFDKDAKGDEYQGTESFIIKLQGANKSYSNLYALVVLNGDNIPHPSANETFGAYNAAVSITNGVTSDYLGGTANGFFMANAANGNAANDKADPTPPACLLPRETSPRSLLADHLYPQVARCREASLRSPSRPLDDLGLFMVRPRRGRRRAPAPHGQPGSETVADRQIALRGPQSTKGSTKDTKVTKVSTKDTKDTKKVRALPPEITPRTARGKH